jgi:hypothetical protein
MLIGGGGLSARGAEWEAAHLAFDAARIAPVSAGDDAFLEDFVEHGFMEGLPSPRGE